MVRFRDAMKNSYKVFYHQGPALGLKTHVLRGRAWIDDSGLSIKGPAAAVVIPLTDIEEVEMFRLHGLARVIRVDYKGGRLYLSVVRFMIGQFASVNFFKSGELYRELASRAKST
jgi:hypothetical protein